MKAGPLTETTFYILLSLALEPLHGYGIIKKVEELSSHSIVLAAGTLYGALDNLKKSGLIEQISNSDNSRRKVYRLTTKGQEVLNDDYLRIKYLFFVAQNILDKENS